MQSISEILHPAVRAGLQMAGFNDSRGVEIHHQGDLPARTGIGSSSSFAVGLIQILKAFQNQEISKHDLALAAIDLEQNRLGDVVGSQDQVAAAYGGLNVIRFNVDGSIIVDPVKIAPEARTSLEDRLMMFYTGTNRLSSEQAKSVVQNIPAKNNLLERMYEMVFEAAEILRSGDLDNFGRLLGETWRLKRGLANSVSTAAIDDIYDTAIAAGALGGKLLGAGGAGFMLFYVPEAAQAAVKNALRNLICVSVKIDDMGSTILYRSDDMPLAWGN